MSISKTDKMKAFSVTNLKQVLHLCYKWKPSNVKPDELDEDETAELVSQVGEAGRDFFVALLTSHKLGIVFHDPTVGTSGSNQNHLLLVKYFCFILKNNTYDIFNFSHRILINLQKAEDLAYWLPPQFMNKLFCFLK